MKKENNMNVVEMCVENGSIVHTCILIVLVGTIFSIFISINEQRTYHKWNLTFEWEKKERIKLKKINRSIQLELSDTIKSMPNCWIFQSALNR